jgi:hypothetical protein
VWPVALSGRLPVVALVGHYPTNKLIGRELISSRKTFHHNRCPKWSYPVLIPVSRSYPRAEGRLLTCYSPVRRSSTPKGLSARLACVKHAASVRPEPGSNSPLNAYKQPQAQTRGLSTYRDPRTNGNRSWPSCETSPRQNREPAPLTRFVQINNALAFSTLLSSQGADAHHRGDFRSRSEATSKPYQLFTLTCTPVREFR